MYVTEPCAKFRCVDCDAWITAAQRASSLVCPECDAYQDASFERMCHFSIQRREVLLGKDEWLDAVLAEARLDLERRKVQQMIERSGLDSEDGVARAEALRGQLEAVEAAMALCRRQAAN